MFKKEKRYKKMLKSSLKNRKNISENDLDNFEIVEEYMQDSHFSQKLLRHTLSEELYFYEFYEEIDWINGNDPQYRVYIPIINKKEIGDLKNLTGTYFGKFNGVARIIDYWYADNTREIKWVK